MGEPNGLHAQRRRRLPGRQSLASPMRRRQQLTWRQRWHKPLVLVKSSAITGSSLKPARCRARSIHVLFLPCTCSGKVVPSGAAAMHRLHCLRNTARCTFCGVAFPAKDLAAHSAASAGGPEQACAAATAGDIARLGVMRQHGADLRSAGAAGDAPIHAAARAGQAATLDFLISQGVSVNSPNALGESPLHIACNRWRAGDAPSPEPARFVRLLLDRGCDVDARTLLGDTPMQIAQRRAFNDALLLLAAVGGSLRPVRWRSTGCCFFLSNILDFDRLQSSRDGRQRPASAGSLKRLASAPGLVGSPPRFGLGASHGESYPVRPQPAAPFLSSEPAAAGGGDATVAGPERAPLRSASPAVDALFAASGAGPTSTSIGLSKPPSARRVNVSASTSSGGTLSPDMLTPRGTAASLAHGVGIAFSGAAPQAAVPPGSGRFEQPH